jgi:hypothetical protein
MPVILMDFRRACKSLTISTNLAGAGLCHIWIQASGVQEHRGILFHTLAVRDSLGREPPGTILGLSAHQHDHGACSNVVLRLVGKGSELASFTDFVRRGE